MKRALQSTGAVWASGGTIVTPAGPLSFERAARRFALYGREALRLERSGAAGPARLCAEMALTLAEALVAADDWTRAAGCGSRLAAPLRGLREFTRQVKTRRYG